MRIQRAMNHYEQEWTRAVARDLSGVSLRNPRALRQLFVVLIFLVSSFGLLHQYVFSRFLADSPVAAVVASFAVAVAVALALYANLHHMDKELIQGLKPHLELIAEDLRRGAVDVLSHDAVESYFDTTQDRKDPDLVIRFPEGEVRVDGPTWKTEGISNPVRGWCEVVRLPQSEQVLSVKATDRPA